jgi:predicted DNA-binding transcriptional regulator AlpA
MSEYSPSQLLRAAQIAAMLQVHPTTIWRWHREGKLGPKVKLSARVSAWYARNIDAFVASRED